MEPFTLFPFHIIFEVSGGEKGKVIKEVGRVSSGIQNFNYLSLFKPRKCFPFFSLLVYVLVIWAKLTNIPFICFLISLGYSETHKRRGVMFSFIRHLWLVFFHSLSDAEEIYLKHEFWRLERVSFTIIYCIYF